MGEVVQFRDYQSSKDLERLRQEQSRTENEAAAIFGIPSMEPFGVDYQAQVYHAPDKDPA